MNTDTRRAAAARLQAARKAAGWTKRTTWLDPASSAKLEAMKAQLGSYDEAIRQAVMGWGERAVPRQGPADAHEANVSVQIGPVEPKPGSRLKKGKT